MCKDLNALRNCFQPRQWFSHEGEPDPFVIADEDAFMWVYRKLDTGAFEVGYYTPDGSWFAESQHASAETAAMRVNFLNGGKRV